MHENRETSETPAANHAAGRWAKVSPLLANIYLHYVFDLWVEAWRKKCASGQVIVVRYVDDTVMGFERREEAERFLRVWESGCGSSDSNYTRTRRA